MNLNGQDQARIEQLVAENGGVIGNKVRLPTDTRVDRPLTDTVVLPLPPSTNRIWRSIVIKGQVRVLKSAEYRKWLVEAVPLARQLGKWPSPVKISIDVCGVRKNRDLDNVGGKALLDGLVAAEVIQGDSITHVREITMRYVPDKIDGKEAVILRLAEYIG